MSDQPKPQPRRMCTVTWGEEKITASPYNVVTIGPFSMTKELGPFEDYATAMEEMNQQLIVTCEKARRQKIISFVQTREGLKHNG